MRLSGHNLQEESMTEEQIRITKHVASQVMGWESSCFSPTESISDAFMAVEKMRERGWWMRLELDPMGYYCRFRKLNEMDMGHALNDSAPMAICLALVASTPDNTEGK